MSHMNRTNPAYAYLAYRRATLQHIINLLIRDYVAPNGQAANKQIYSDEVMRGDAEVPMPEIVRFIEELQQEDAELLLEMNKFDFRKIEEPKPVAIEPPKPKDMADEQSKDPTGTGGPAAPPAAAPN